MNGLVYVCGGCDRKGAVEPGSPGYDCPVCRFRWEFPENRRTAVFRSMHRSLPRPPRPTAEVRHPPARLRSPLYCEKCKRRHPTGWECDPKINWKRKQQWIRFVRRQQRLEKIP